MAPKKYGHYFMILIFFNFLYFALTAGDLNRILLTMCSHVCG